MKAALNLQSLALLLLVCYVPLLLEISISTKYTGPWLLYALNSVTVLPILQLIYKRVKVGCGYSALLFTLVGLDALTYLELTATSYEPWLFKGL